MRFFFYSLIDLLVLLQQLVFPGLWLTEVTLELYRVPDQR